MGKASSMRHEPLVLATPPSYVGASVSGMMSPNEIRRLHGLGPLVTGRCKWCRHERVEDARHRCQECGGPR